MSEPLTMAEAAMATLEPIPPEPFMERYLRAEVRRLEALLVFSLEREGRLQKALEALSSVAPWRPVGSPAEAATSAGVGQSGHSTPAVEGSAAEGESPAAHRFHAKPDAPLRFRLLAYLHKLRERAALAEAGRYASEAIYLQVAQELEALLDG